MIAFVYKTIYFSINQAFIIIVFAYSTIYSILFFPPFFKVKNCEAIKANPKKF